MLIDNSRKKPAKTKKNLKSALIKKLDSLPTLSNYAGSKSLFLEAVALMFPIWGLALKAWRFPTIAHAGFFVGNASIEAVIYNYIEWLYTNGYIGYVPMILLVITLYISLGIACSVFVAKLYLEGKKKVFEIIDSAKKHSNKKKRAVDKKQTNKKQIDKDAEENSGE